MWMLPFKVSFNKHLCASFFALTSTCNSCSYGIFIIIIIHTCVHTCVDQWSISGVSQEPRSLFGKGRVYHWPGAHQAKIAANLWSCLLCTGVHIGATTSRFFFVGPHACRASTLLTEPHEPSLQGDSFSES